MAALMLPDEVILHEIFPRLHDDGDVFALFRCAATCRHWRRLVASSSFLRRRWPSPLLGFFARRCHVPGDAGTPLAFFVPSGRSSAATGLCCSSPPFRCLSSFFCDATDSLDGGEPLASSGSLLLVRIFSDDDDPASHVARLVVCDLLAGTCYMLPELDCECRFPTYANSYGYAILPSRRYHSGGADRPPTNFRVLMIGQDKHKSRYNLHVFTSETFTWSTPVKCFNAMVRQSWSMIQAKAVVCRGYAHWLFSSMSNFHVLNVEVETGHVSLTNLLSPTPARRLMVPGDYVGNAMELYRSSLYGLSNADRLTTTPDGTLLTLCVYSNYGRRLEMWTRQEAVGEHSAYGDAEWLRTRVIELKLMLNPEIAQMTCIFFGERSAMLLIVDGRRRMYIGEIEEVTDQFQGHSYDRIVPVEIDWPRFPARWAK